MILSNGLTSDRQPLDEFRRRGSQLLTIHPDPILYAGIRLDLFEWSENATHGIERTGLNSVQELESKSDGIIRVILAPRDIPAPGKTEALIELFETCSVPSPFIDESLRDVSQSFAACEDVNDTMCIWFHLLCKTLMEGRGKGAVYDSEAKTQKVAKARSEADFSWIKPGIVMKIRKQPKTTPKPVRTLTSNSDDTLMDAPVKPKVELVCFGAPNTLHDRLRTIAVTTTCDELLDDPYMLLTIIFEEMFKILDCTAWAVADKFGRLETKTLEIASMPGKASEELPTDLFTALHNLAKHAIYLRENCEEALATLKDFSDHHKAATGEDPNASQKRTRQALKYRKTLFESTQRRLASLNARISNIIQLSFHIVTQGDSKVMQSENQSMKTIAVMTLVFMPLGTVASIFGSQFMELQEEQPHHITVSRDFWLMWIIAVPLTVVVWTIWWFKYMDAKARLVGRMEKAEHGYMVWKMLHNMLRRVEVKKGMSDA